MSFRDIFVSSGGIGGYLNQFIEESLFDPPRFHSHPFKFWPCAGSIDPTIRDLHPKALLEKKSVSCGSSQTSRQLSTPFISL
jgi:hypothetical protein